MGYGTMDEDGLLDQALGLELPWFVERTLLDDEQRQIVVYLNFGRGGTFTCRGCGNNGCKAYDTAQKRWRHLDFLGYRTILQAPSPRVDCPSCGVRQAELPWTRPHRKLTLPFEQFVVDLAREMPVRAVARVVGEHDTRLWRIVNDYSE